MEEMTMRKANEMGAVKKDWGGRVPVAVVYPNSYYIGMSNLAVHLFYRMLNGDPRIAAERVFLADGKSSVSIESGRPISAFRIAIFTFSFETDYMNIPQMFGRNLKLLKKERGGDWPALVAGGPAVTMNPPALKDIFDAIVPGEFEEMSGEFLDAVKSADSKREFCERIDDRGRKSVIVPDLNDILVHSAVWTGDTEFGHMHLVEISRGCPWRCRFCATPPTYAPYRVRSVGAIRDSIRYGLPYRRHVGLVGADVLGHPDFMEIASELVRESVKVSVSSLRANRVTREAAMILSASGHKRATLGIEAGTEALRDSIGKALPDRQIFDAVRALSRAGITNLKLYFMAGLPRETEGDIKGIALLTREIRKVILSERSQRTLSPNISVVVAPFVPKKTTPFEKEAFAGVEYLSAAMKELRAEIGKIPNTKFTGESPRKARIEHILCSSPNVAGIISSQGR
jgi:radical SAM superfamily enzyme YgiQ (UPF0313 family)